MNQSNSKVHAFGWIGLIVAVVLIGVAFLYQREGGKLFRWNKGSSEFKTASFLLTSHLIDLTDLEQAFVTGKSKVDQAQRAWDQRKTNDNENHLVLAIQQFRDVEYQREKLVKALWDECNTANVPHSLMKKLWDEHWSRQGRDLKWDQRIPLPDGPGLEK